MTTVLIPAYQPDGMLPDLVEALRRAAPDNPVVVVDDGSGAGYGPVFDAAARRGARVIRYERNQGKGHALKVGFAAIADGFPGEPVVCADCDGQHAVADILRVAATVEAANPPGGPLTMVLGMRTFSGEVPLRSRLGNAATRMLFRLATGRRIHDTQTGLRGYPAGMLTWLCDVRGDRYEYELNQLLQARDCGMRIAAIDIATIYLRENESSHFRPVADSIRIYAPLLKFVLSSVAAFVIDTVVLLALSAVTGSLLVAVLGARLISAGVNFGVNRRLVFEHGRERPAGRTALGYFGLVVVLLSANYGLLLGFAAVGLPLLVAKVSTEVMLFLISYTVQQRLLFARRAGNLPARTNPAVGYAQL